MVKFLIDDRNRQDTEIVKKSANTLRAVPSDYEQHPQCLLIDTQDRTTRADQDYQLLKVARESTWPREYLLFDPELPEIWSTLTPNADQFLGQ